MPLANGTRLGPYEIVAPLGAGGMGEVYRARDTRLGRDVALKVLPAHLSANPELKQRLEREARAVSSLSHPNICVLHDIGHHEGTDFLVMEYLEGESLAQRCARGPLGLEELLRIGMQVADALEKAHRQGLTHRDLKPGNVMLTKTGAKLLDFGLAKARAMPGVTDLTSTPTVSSPLGGAGGTGPLTAEGTIVGTFQYMSPEQLEGKEADARSDIFAFGAVLYEMATGQRAFGGKSQASLIASILKEEPRPIAELAPMTPPALDRVVRTCLAKDPDERWQTAHDVKLQLAWISEGGSLAGVPAPVVARRKGREKLAWAAAAVLLVAAIGFAVGFVQRALAPPQVVRSTLLPPEGWNISETSLALSPDGRQLAFVARDDKRRYALWVRPLDSLAARQLPGTEDAWAPFWSPDSRWLGFFAGGKLKKIDLAGGPAQTLCDAPQGRGGAWNHEGVIIFAPDPGAPLLKVSAAGGASTPFTRLDPSSRDASHRWPVFLPDGKYVLFYAGPGAGRAGTIQVASLDGQVESLPLTSESNAVYANGHLLFVRETTLMAQPFDPSRRKLSGEAFPVAEQIGVDPRARGEFTVSQNGILAYPAAPERSSATLTWFDRNGRPLGTLTEDSADYRLPRISPDGARAVVTLFSRAGGKEESDLWVYEVNRSGVRSRFTFDAAIERIALWSPDGRTLIFNKHQKGPSDLFQKASSGLGAEELLVESAGNKTPSDISPDGKFAIYSTVTSPGTGQDLYLVPLTGDPASRKPKLFLQTPFLETSAVFSPDGRWVAFVSNQSGPSEVYVVPFPEPSGRWQVSTGGGTVPRWRGDSREIFYLSPTNEMMAVEVNGRGTSFEVGKPRMLFSAQPQGGAYPYDVTRDGQRFLIATSREAAAAAPLTLVVNWPAAVKK
jgi:Tol biopolymer transport system component